MQDTKKEVDKMKNTMKKPVAIPVEKLRPFAGHPFKVKDDDEMNTLIESIQTQGILSPLIVRPVENTDEYEVISGHRRLHAAQKAGITEIPALIYTGPQGDLTTCLGWQDTDSLPQTLSNKLSAVMREEQQDPFSGILSHEEKVDLVPSNLDLSTLEMSLVTAMSRESVMKNYLSQVKDRYDYVLIDCMPSLGMITLNALTAADSVIIPVQAQYLPAKGMTQLLSTIAKVKKHTNRNLTIDGILLTLVDGRTNLAKSTVEALRENFGCRIRIYRTTIPIAVKAAEVSSKGKSIYAYEPSSTVSKAYTDFTKEVLADGRQKERLHASHEHTR